MNIYRQLIQCLKAVDAGGPAGVVQESRKAIVYHLHTIRIREWILLYSVLVETVLLEKEHLLSFEKAPPKHASDMMHMLRALSVTPVQQGPLDASKFLPWHESKQGSIGPHYGYYPALPAIFQIVL
jgi:hypothetical protein